MGAEAKAQAQSQKEIHEALYKESLSVELVDVERSKEHKEEEVLITVDGRLLIPQSKRLEPSFYELSKKLGLKVCPVEDSLFDRLRQEFLEILEQEAIAQVEDEEEEVENLPETQIDRLIEYLLANAVRLGASDIHITPFKLSRKKATRVEFRVDGILSVFKVYPSSKYAERIINKLKTYAGLDIANSILPQDGKFKRKMGGGFIEVRLSTIPIYEYGERAVLRIQSSERILKELSLDKLGIEERDLKVYRSHLEKGYGMIIDVGPTGEGKSTTLLTSILELAEKGKGEKAILTVEDPVEVDLSTKGIVQTEVDEKQGRTYPKILRAFLRQDPDVIMVGEIRDSDTAQISTRAALTGHLVLTTLHATDSISAIERLKDFGLSPVLIASTVRVFLSQRLVRVLCPHCKRKGKIPIEVINKYNLPFDEAYFPVGCDKCLNGYIGRTAVVEVLEVDAGLKERILSGASPVEIKRYLKEKGFRNMWANGLEKVKRGETSLEELLRKVSPDDVLNKVQAQPVIEFGTVFWPHRRITVRAGKRQGYLFDASSRGLSVLFEEVFLLEPNKEVEIEVEGAKVRFFPKSFRRVEGGGFIVGGIYHGNLPVLKGEIDV